MENIFVRMKAKRGRHRTKTLFIVTTIRSTYTFRWLAYHSPSHYFLASLIYHEPVRLVEISWADQPSHPTVTSSHQQLIGPPPAI